MPKTGAANARVTQCLRLVSPVQTLYPKLVTNQLAHIVIQPKYMNGSSSNRRQTLDRDAEGHQGANRWQEMFVPQVASGIEECSHSTRSGVDARQVEALLQVAVPACERQIVRPGQSAMLSGDDVFNMKWAPERRLRQLAILATIAGASPDFPRNLIHAWG